LLDALTAAGTSGEVVRRFLESVPLLDEGDWHSIRRRASLSDKSFLVAGRKLAKVSAAWRELERARDNTEAEVALVQVASVLTAWRESGVMRVPDDDISLLVSTCCALLYRDVLTPASVECAYEPFNDSIPLYSLDNRDWSRGQGATE